LDASIEEARIYDNTCEALENIRDRILPRAHDGDIVSVDNVLPGRMYLFDYGIDWFTKEVFSEVRIRNNSENTTTYDLQCFYDKRFTTVDLLPGVSTGGIGERRYSISVVREEQISLQPNEERIVTVWYMRNGQGNIPEQLVWFQLVGMDGKAVYGLDSETTQLGTTFVTDEGEVVPQEQTYELRTRTYPVRSEVERIPRTNAHELLIYVTNPFDFPTVVSLRQPAPSNVRLVYCEGGDMVEGDVVWSLQLNPNERKVCRVVWDRSDNLGTEGVVPPAILGIHDSVADTRLEFQSDSLLFEKAAASCERAVLLKGHEIVAERQIADTLFEYDLRVRAQNVGAWGLRDVVLRFREAPLNTILTDDTVVFSAMDSQQEVLSDDTYTLQTNRKIEGLDSEMSWEICRYAEPNRSDLNYDWITDARDLVYLAQYWLETGEDMPGDIHPDHRVDLIDFAELANTWRRQGDRSSD